MESLKNTFSLSGITKVAASSVDPFTDIVIEINISKEQL